MKKSTRALVGLAVIDLLLLAGGAWMFAQVRSGAWHAPDPVEATKRIGQVIGAAIGIVTAILMMAAFVHRRRGD